MKLAYDKNTKMNYRTYVRYEGSQGEEFWMWPPRPPRNYVEVEEGDKT